MAQHHSAAATTWRRASTLLYINVHARRGTIIPARYDWTLKRRNLTNAKIPKKHRHPASPRGTFSARRLRLPELLRRAPGAKSAASTAALRLPGARHPAAGGDQIHRKQRPAV